MPGFLRQSTASQSRAIGPFLDDTDFKTPETGLTIANTDIKLVVNGAASANKNSGGGTHRVNGVYGVTFDATDTATVGEMEVSVVVAGALPVFDKFFVIEEVVYDALYAASAPGYLQPTVAARTLDVTATGAAGIDWGNIENPTTAQNLSATNIDVDQVIASVSGNVGGNVVGSVGSVVGAPTLQNVVDGVWNELKSAHTTANSFGDFLDIEVSSRAAATVLGTPAGASVSADIAAVKAETASIQTDTNDIQTRLPAALIGGRMDSDVEAINAVPVNGAGVLGNEWGS